jgi:hypothetical protein
MVTLQDHLVEWNMCRAEKYAVSSCDHLCSIGAI